VFEILNIKTQMNGRENTIFSPKTNTKPSDYVFQKKRDETVPLINSTPLLLLALFSWFLKNVCMFACPGLSFSKGWGKKK
jgi:hypothetical protein